MRCFATLLISLLMFTPGARAAFHVMQIEEIIGALNGNTAAQAIQLRLRSGGQNQVQVSKLWAWDAAGANRILLLDIASPVSNSAAGARILLTTSSFTSMMIAQGSPTFTPDFTLASAIPFSYFNAGRVTFEDDSGTVAGPGTIYWSVAWGGASYTGPVTGNTQNDLDGDFGKTSLTLRNPNLLVPGFVFTGGTGLSTSNDLQYRATVGNAGTTTTETVIKNNGTVFTIVPEPGQAALLALGALALGGFAYGRRRSSTRL